MMIARGQNIPIQIIYILQGAVVTSSKHASNYTALHFAALSGKPEICRLLLLAGADPNAINSVNRKPAQMAAFVGNHSTAACINNFLPLNLIEKYTEIQGQQSEPTLPLILLPSFHKFIIQSNIHPVRIAMNLQRIGILSDNLQAIRKVLNCMSERAMENPDELNEIKSFKYHYISWIVDEINRCREYFQSQKDISGESKTDYLELFARRVLKENTSGQLDYVEITVRNCVREFKHIDLPVVRQIMMQLTCKEHTPALDIIKSAINGQHGFVSKNSSIY